MRDETSNERGLFGSLVIWALFGALVAAGFWAYRQTLDQVTRAPGVVITSSRSQVVQAVDGGVLAHLNVREGDRVRRGQVLAALEQTRVTAAHRELELKLAGQRAQAARLTAESLDSERLTFPPSLKDYPDLTALQQALFQQKRQSLREELRTMAVSVDLAKEESHLVKELARTGDISRADVIRTDKSLNEAEALRVNRRNKYLQEARAELAKVEDDLAQTEQLLRQRAQQLADSEFVAGMAGIVKNVRVTTIGGVLRPGEELMQIVPLEGTLIVEAKVRPADIAHVRPGLPANLRLDPFDYTVFGAVAGKVGYVSADTLQEETKDGVQNFYRVHVLVEGNPVRSQTGQELSILPGMTAQVDIRTGQRSVLDYVLKPLRLTAAEAFGER